MADVEIIERIAPAQSFGTFLMDALRDPNLPTADKQLLLATRREVLADEAKEAYQFHFSQFAAELPPVERDGMVDLGSKGRYLFSTYEEMDRVLRPLLVKHGLALQFWSSDAERENTVIIHGELFGWGWQRESVYPVPPDAGPGRNALQARGSSQTYAKRYIADLLCNIVRKGIDNDGRGNVDNFIDGKQVKELEALIEATNTDVMRFLEMMITDVKDIADIRQRDFSRLKMALLEKQKGQMRKEMAK